MKIIGYQRKQGDFSIATNGDTIRYDNVVLHVINDSISNSVQGFCGSSCEQIKIKTKDLLNIFGCDYSNLSKFLDVDVAFQYSIVGGKVILSHVVILDSNSDFNFVG